MKARVKATGEIVDVYERYDDLAMETVFKEFAGSYRPDELEIVPDDMPLSDDAVISISKLRDILEDVASSLFEPRRLNDATIDEIIDRVKESI